MKFNFFKKKKNESDRIRQLRHELEVTKKHEKLEAERTKIKAMLEAEKARLTSQPEETDPEKIREKKLEEIKERLEKKKVKPKKKLGKALRGIKKLQKKKLVKKKKKKRFTLRGFARAINLQNFLDKAGLDLDARELTRKIFKINIYIFLFFSLIAVIAVIVNKKSFADLLVFLIGFWLTAFFILLAILWLGYLFYLDMKIFQRTKAVEEVFPDFLQLTSANISAGMTVDKALWYSVRPGFGVLAKEIETVAKNTMAGEDLSTALLNFSKKYNSKIIQRSINLLLEGMDAGGEMADLLNKIALNIEETKLLKKEMAASVTTYVIFIAFATILAAPVLFGLATQLLEVISAITSRLDTTTAHSSAFFSFSFTPDTIKSRDFRIFSYLMLIISSFSSACIINIIKKGRIKEGLTQIPVFILVAVLVYTIASALIRGAFSSFL
ncbi:hypothetical protein AYK26_00395 [Euryarchaeota archaeon SM23-78]|nr:MAG: hypothetical protein AYK26_00395 [Euryarchaeota archaeon SM23-78]MBW3001125.1 type II secretion system F family protein [Candidatus Woesearchaeota archaeon]